MGTLFAASLTGAIILAALYVPYSLVLARENRPRLNRALIIALYITALAAPLIIPMLANGRASGAAAAVVQPAEIKARIMNGQSGGSHLWGTLLTIYVTGMAGVAALTLLPCVKLWRIIRQSEPKEICGVRVRVSADPTIAPFSILRTIIIPAKDVDENVEMVIAHERAHVAANHWADLMLAHAVCVVQWFNPASWFMLRQLRAVHEYQADSEVIKSGVDCRAYQMLLVRKAIGGGFPSLANSLSHSNLKNRITMMYSKSPKGLRRVAPFLLLPVLGGAVWLTRVPAVASVLTQASTARMIISDATPSAIMIEDAPAADIVMTASSPVDSKVSETKPPVQTAAAKGNTQKEETVYAAVDEMPEYPGGLQQMMKDLASSLVYPEEAVKSQTEGKVVIGFIVDKSGKITDCKVIKSVTAELDAAAIAAVKQLKPFEPAKVNGEPVMIEYALPVMFKLTEEAKVPESTPATEAQ